MTETQQKDLEELREQLQQEEENCEWCPDYGILETCERCGTGGNISDLERLIESIQE